MPDPEQKKAQQWIENVSKKIADKEHIQIKGIHWVSINEPTGSGRALNSIRKWELILIAYNEFFGQKELSVKFTDEELEDCLTDNRRDQKRLEADLGNLITSLSQRKIGF